MKCQSYLAQFNYCVARVLVTGCAALVVGFAGFSVARATEHTTVTFDGAWWNSLSASDKTVAVQAMIVGYTAGFSDGAYAASESTPGVGSFSDIDILTKRGFATYTKAMTKNASGSDRTFGSMIAELDSHFEENATQPARPKELVSPQVYCAIMSGKHCVPNDFVPTKRPIKNHR